jgi:hypothetical protein
MKPYDVIRVNNSNSKTLLYPAIMFSVCSYIVYIKH